MVSVGNVLRALEQIAPAQLAFSWDRVGLQVGDPAAAVTRAVVSLDRSIGAVEFTFGAGAELLVSHHPLLFKPLDSLVATEPVARTATLLVQHRISFIAAHTNWDVARGGINDCLATTLRLSSVTGFGSSPSSGMFKVVVLVPASSEGDIIDAAASAGAGVIGNYDRCAFISHGQGTFKPGDGARPYIGAVGSVESVQEARIEMVVPESLANQVEAAIRSAHPYEEPAIDFFRLRDVSSNLLGRVGNLETPMSLVDFGGRVDECLQTRCMVWGEPKGPVARVAVIGGSADDEWRNAQAAGADVLVTGEVKQHVALEASESGFAIVAAGHYATEQPGCIALRDRLAEIIPEVEWLSFEPERGRSGRPQ